MTALLLAAVGGTRGKTSIALSAHKLLAVKLLGKSSKGGVKDTTSQSQHQVKGRLLLDIVVRKSAAVLELLTSEDQSADPEGYPPCPESSA